MILLSSIHVCAELKNHFSFGTHSFLCFPDLFMCDADAQESLNSADCLMTILTLILNPATKSSASELRGIFLQL